jgi:hypothetical protein
LTPADPAAEIAIMIHAVTDERLRRVWAILVGMSVLAATVEVVTITIHDRIH